MNIKELITKKKGEAEAPPEVQQGTQSSENAAAAAARELLSLEGEGKLKRPIEEYVSNPEFIKLLSEFPCKAAVRIFDAEQESKAAHERGRDSAVEDMNRRKNMPRSIKDAGKASAVTDFSKISSEEFERIKKALSK